jgi:hypothetical protein
MKLILLSIILLSATALNSCRVAATQPPGDPKAQRQQQRVIELESQLDGLRHTNDRWQILCASAGVGAVVLLILGTALGAKTRHDALATS